MLLLIGLGGALWVNWRAADPEYRPAVRHSDNPQGLVSQTPVADQSIAVLPFVNMSGNAENEYFSDGISEEFLHGLTNLEGDLRVAARTSSFYFKGKAVDIATIGEKLNVSTVLEGSVRRVGNRVRISAQLINVADGYHLWSETYDRTLDDIFAVQDEIALAIVDALKVELGMVGGDDALVSSGTRNAQAYSAYLQGVYQVKHGSGEHFDKAVDHFKRAVEIDPAYARAWGYLASSSMNASIWRGFSEVGPLAKQAFDRALALDPHEGEALTAKGDYTLRTTWDWRAAQHYYAQALQSDADRAHMLQAYANVILLPLGQTDTARRLYEEAILNDPYSWGAKFGLLILAILEQRWPEVLTRAIWLEEIFPDEHAGVRLQCEAYARLGDWESVQVLADRDIDWEQGLNWCRFQLALNLTPGRHYYHNW
jgi:TolB-like protein